MQYGWLDLFGERWLLLTGNLKYPARSWVDQKAALAELREEGWTIADHPSRRRFTEYSARRSRGYVMVRTLH
jgi:hypothetical protein